ncbi:MAG: FtsK/SpoIIIE domain-containing protein, partial [Solirubrobacteraceae bacterium]
LLVGRPGSGKSTLLHAFIAAATTLYSPEELELHLIDFKEGVEFKAYATHALPHARSIAIESDREFGLSVLQAIQAELTWRANLLRGSEGSHASLEALRTKAGARLPRIVLLFDEFQVLFARNDKIGAEAAALLESLIRQGRGFGIHVFLASQSLSGLDALGSHVPQLLPVRVLLPASEADAVRVLGEGNPGGKLLLHAGDGILNPAGGSVEANQPFRGSLLSEDERNELLPRLRELADQRGFLRRPVVFEGNTPLPAEDTPPKRFVDEIRGAPGRALRIRFGAPMAITGSADIDLRREAGANALLVARDGSSGAVLGDMNFYALPRAVAANVIASAVAGRARVEVADFLPMDDGLESAVARYAEAGRASLHRRRQLPELLTSLRDTVSERVAADDTGAETILLVLYGVHRARDFDTESVDFDTEPDLPGLLATIVRDGPEVGVHTFIWCETLATLSRRLGSGITRECSWRLAARMSADDSQSLIGVDTASGLREQQLVVANEDIGLLQRCTSLSDPPASWVTELLSTIDCHTA